MIRSLFHLFFGFAILLFSGFPAIAGIPWCTPDTEKGSYCKAYYQDLRPTQMVVGMKAVDEKIEKLESMSEKKLKEYLQRKEVPVVIHGEEIYIIDHHHLMMAVHKADIDREKVFLRVIENWSRLDRKTFWDRMIKNNYCRLIDQNGNPVLASALPKQIWQLKDDPYRSLAYFVREEGGFLKTNTPFVEFIWADFFRKHITPDQIKRSFKKALERAFELAESPKAKGLPGYVGDSCEYNLRGSINPASLSP